MSTATTTAAPLLIDAREAAARLGIGRTKLYELHAAGAVPRAIRLGRAVRWRADELAAWVEAGCPSRVEWETRRKVGRP